MESCSNISATNRNCINDDCCNNSTNMKYACGLCTTFLEGHEEVSSIQDDKSRSATTLISEPNDIVKVESLVASLSKLDCIVEEKKEESELEMGEYREELNELETVADSDDSKINEVDEHTATPPDAEQQPVVLITTEPEVDNTPAVEETIVESTLECDFDKNPTDLYLCLMNKDWSGTIRRCVQRPDEAKTWIYRKEPTGTLRWKLLPIHAGIIFNAPIPVIDALLHAHLYGADCKDDQGMIPLHLAIRMNSDHTIVEKLVSARPNSVKAQDRKGRTPRALAEKQVACPQKLLVIQTLDNVNTTTISPSSQQRSIATPTASRSVSVNATNNDSSIVPTTPKVEVEVVKETFSAKEVECIKQTFELQTEKASREETARQNELKQKIEALEKNAKRDAETMRMLEEKVHGSDETESELRTKISELEVMVQSTIAEKSNVEDSNKAVIVNLVSQVGVVQAKLTELGNEKDSLASTLADLEESSKQEIAKRKLRCLELERQLGQVTFMKDEAEESLSKAEQTIVTQQGQINLCTENMTTLQTKLAETEMKLEEVTVSEQELAWQNHALSVTGQMYAKNKGNDTSGRSTDYQNQIKTLEKEREELRETVNKLSVKLYKVVGFLDEMVQEQEAIITETMTRDSEMVEPTTFVTNTDGSVLPVPVVSDDRMKLLSNVSGMKEQIIGVIDSVIEGMPEELEDDVVDQVCTTLNADEVETPIVTITRPVVLP